MGFVNLCHIYFSATVKREWVLDPFTGSSTTSIACSLLNRRFLGIDREKEFLDLSVKRFEECQILEKMTDFRNRIPDLRFLDSLSEVREDAAIYGDKLF